MLCIHDTLEQRADFMTLAGPPPTLAAPTLIRRPYGRVLARVAVDPREATTQVFVRFGTAPELDEAARTMSRTITAAGTHVVEFDLGQLLDRTTYYLQFAASNAGGAACSETFRCGHAPEREQARGDLEVTRAWNQTVHATRAVLCVDVQTSARDTNAELRLSCNPDLSHAHQAPYRSLRPASDAPDAALSWEIEGLQPGATYYWQATLRNTRGRALTRVIPFRTPTLDESPSR